ncbi:hypothetical protein KY331_00260 [Candidatus Woesearchaeota archaeon]|nr:hypothetical protein [Candidatus Woesearchaeota archaeon]
MASKYLYAILIIGILFFVFGCEQEEKETVSIGKAFIGGANGLDLSFTEGAPPDEVFDVNFPFSINVKLENVGEWDITNPNDMTLSIIGIDPGDFGKTPAFLVQDNSVPMRGAKLDPQGNLIQGTITNLDFTDLQYASTVTGKVQFVIRASACYEYGTRVNTKVCILEDLLGITRKSIEEAVCNPNEAKDYENSGAPVQVSNVKQTVMGTDRISLAFDVEHVGTGTIFRKDTECSTTIADKDKVYVKVDTGDPNIKCSGLEGSLAEGFTTLFSGKRAIICTQQLPTPRGDFEKPITITLEYGYRQHIDKQLTVKHAGQ